MVVCNFKVVAVVEVEHNYNVSQFKGFKVRKTPKHTNKYACVHACMHA